MAADGIRLAMAANIPEGTNHPTKVATTKTQTPVTTMVGTSRPERQFWWIRNEARFFRQKPQPNVWNPNMSSTSSTSAKVGKKEAMRKLVVGWRLWLTLLFFNILVCACSGRVGWMLFWAIAFSTCAYEYGYEYGKTEQRPRLFL
jgi:hypothetical protein